MPNKSYSRRRFLGNIAAGSTGAALASLPGNHSASASGAVADPPYPVTMVSYPLYAASGSLPLENVKIVTTDVIPQWDQDKLQSFSPTLKLQQCRSFEEFHREVADAHVIFADFTREDFAAAKHLRWIQSRAAGVYELCSWPELVESPVVLTNMQRIYSFGISETVIGLLLSLAHGLNQYALQTSKHIWRPVDEPFIRALSARRFGNGRDKPWNMADSLREISGLTMGTVGLGGIGTDTAYRAHYGFGMRILAVDPKPLPKPAFVEELHSLDWLPKMVPQVDVLLCAAPHTKESTQHAERIRLPRHEADRLFHQRFARHLSGYTSARSRPQRGLDCRRRARCDGPGTFAARSPSVDRRQRHHYITYLRPLGPIRATRAGPVLRKRPALR